MCYLHQRTNTRLITVFEFLLFILPLCGDEMCAANTEIVLLLVLKRRSRRGSFEIRPPPAATVIVTSLVNGKK